MFLCLLLVTTCAERTSTQALEKVRTEDDFLKEMVVYKGLSYLLSFFKNETNPLARQILETFQNECQYSENPVYQRGALVKPIIVIEGNHKSSRDVVVSGLSQMLNARYITHPAPCIHRYHKMLPRGSLLRRAFYLLSNYAGSFYAKTQLNRPIIINGYWSEQFAFTMTHFYPPGKLPPITSDIFNFPPDLLKPDIIFYLNFPDTLIYSHVTTRSPLTWKPRMLEIYRHMAARYPIIIKDVKPLYRITAEEIHRHITEHFYDKLFGLRNLTESYK